MFMRLDDFGQGYWKEVCIRGSTEERWWWWWWWRHLPSCTTPTHSSDDAFTLPRTRGPTLWYRDERKTEKNYLIPLLAHKCKRMAFSEISQQGAAIDCCTMSSNFSMGIWSFVPWERSGRGHGNDIRWEHGEVNREFISFGSACCCIDSSSYFSPQILPQVPFASSD